MTDLDTPPTDDRFLRSFWRLVRWALPARFRFFGIYEYRIAKAYPGGAAISTALDLQATEATLGAGLEDIAKVQPWPGVAGCAEAATLGARVLVSFIGGDQSRPFVIAWAPSGDPGWLPATLSIDSTGLVYVGPTSTLVHLGSGTDMLVGGAATGRLVRYGDAVVVGTAGGPITAVVPSPIARAVAP